VDRRDIVSQRIRRAVSKDMGLAAILLYVPFEITEEAGLIARTDGRQMSFGGRFFGLAEDQQVGICIHEALHVALCHIQRARSLQECEGSAFDWALWNLATDAVINRAISHIQWCELPQDVVKIELLISKPALDKKPAALWTSEEIYETLKQYRPELAVSAWTGDLRPGQTGDTPFTRQMETGTWRERLVRAQASSRPGSVLRSLSADIPAGRIAWEKEIAAFIRARVMPTTEAGWSRPSRRTLAQGPTAAFVEPGVERKKGLRRAAIVIDTSGSIDDELLSVFFGEVNSVVEQAGCELVLVDCDAEVQQVSIHRQPVRDYVPKGGGGTDFRPAFQLLAQFSIDVAIYMTDLQGQFPDRPPPFPVLWAVTQDLPVPFGRKILIPRR
jgi:predicted metal-dependent peptidase